ncbi:Eif5b protein [Baffinella frigidus]|nr:Eif5b protein [Cryptophyta sp. CCMP2293]
MGVKIAAQGLEGAIAGTQVLIAGKEDNIEELKLSVMEDLEEVMKDISKESRGVHVQASTLGALEALLDFLRNSTIPVASINIGPVHKRDVIKASVMAEKEPDLALILAFDVKISTDAAELAKSSGVTIFTADIIYHLFDKFTKHMALSKERQRKVLLETGVAVFPAVIKIIKGDVFNKKSPIIIGCEIEHGILRVGTPLCIPALKFMEIGKVGSIEHNHKELKEARKGMSVAVKIDAVNDQQAHLLFGRHFDHTHRLYSSLTRDGITALKTHFKDDLSTDEWRLVQKMKQIFSNGVQQW